MAINDLDNNEHTYNPGHGLTNLNPDAPDFAKDIMIKDKNFPLDVSVNYTPHNPYDVVLPGGFFSSESLKGVQEKPSFFESAKAQAYKMNATLQGANALDSMAEQTDPTFYETPDGWTSKTDVDKFVNVRSQYLKALFDAKSPKHQDQILQKIYEEQQRDDDIANGSWLAWLVGGAAGIATDPMTYIPIAGWVKYGKISSSLVMSAAKAIPGATTYGVLSSAAEQMDKVNGNMHDFVVDSFVKTAFAAALFGGIGAAASLSEKMALWDLKGLAKAHIDGMDFKFTTDEAGKITGYKAVDTTGGLSAEKVSFYQDMADSTFYKSGVFKIPYVGAGIIKMAGMPVFGSPLINLINSSSTVMRSFIDRVADHNFITKGVAEGAVAPKKFSSLMNQEYSKLRAMSVQYNALHLERNGFDIKNRIAGNAIDTALNLHDRSLKLLGKDLEKSGYVSREAFNDEVQQALHSNEPSQHASVNEAASLSRKQMDNTYKAYREAYGLPKDWLPPKTAEAFLTRVYDTPYMNANKGKWVSSVSNWLKEADEVISARMEPIRDIENKIADHKEAHNALIERPNVTDAQVKKSSQEFIALRARKKALEDRLHNDLRNDPDLQLHVDDWNALSADEAKEIKDLTKRRDIAQKEVNERKEIVAEIKKELQKNEAGKLKAKTAKTGKKGQTKEVLGAEILKTEEAKLAEVVNELQEEEEKLQQMMHEGQINSRLFRKNKDSFVYELKDPNERLKFRDTYGTHAEREEHAKAYYNTILNQTPEDTINQVMGRFTGNSRENPIKSRTLLLPDQVLYDGKFLTNDLMSKISNYSTYLSRRTHLKSVFKDVSIDGGIEPVIVELGAEHERFHTSLSNRKTELEAKLENKELDAKERANVDKQIRKLDKELAKSRKDFDKNKEIMNHIYDKMMGIQKTSRRAMQVKSAIMSITAWANLPFVPLTQINDLSAIALQHGFIPFIRDGLAPVIENLITLGKGKDAEAFRKTAPSIHLGLQDVQMGYADRNWSSQTNPYLNLGRFVNTLEKVAHLSSNFTGTNYIDNFLQRMTGSVVQSELMRILHSWKAGSLSKRDGLYIRKYGIDVDKYGDRMLSAFETHGGGKTKLGGYQSHFWQWQDVEASNVFGDAIFRSIKDTQISAGLIDAPLLLDDNGPIGIMGSFIRGFQGWAFASVNRYVIPSLQQADAEKLIGVMMMLGTGYLVDPMRRVVRGEEMFPENLSAKQIGWATINNSGYFSYFANILSDANLISGDSLMGNLRSDKYKDRSRSGFLGPAWGTANRMADIISALGSNEMNEADAKKMARMIPFANASWTALMSKYLVESLGLPKTRREARALKEIS